MRHNYSEMLPANGDPSYWICACGKRLPLDCSNEAFNKEDCQKKWMSFIDMRKRLAPLSPEEQKLADMLPEKK